MPITSIALQAKLQEKPSVKSNMHLLLVLIFSDIYGTINVEAHCDFSHFVFLMADFKVLRLHIPNVPKV